MKKIYILACATLISGFAFGQVKTELTKKYENRSKVATGKSKSAIITPEWAEKVTAIEEDWDSGNAFPNTWTVSSGVNSTISVPAEQAWHEEANGNPGNCASVLYNNSADVHDEWIVSPSVTLPNNGLPLRCAFEFNTSNYWHITPFNNADITLNISTDGGANWTPLWQEDTIVFETYVWTLNFLDISSYAGQSVMFGWHYDGQDGAQFNMDNFRVLEVEGVDLLHQTSIWNFGGQGNPIIPYTKMPVAQTTDITTMVTTTNVGAFTGPDTYADVIVAGPVSYTGTTGMLDVAVGAVDTLYNNAGYNPNAIGTYTVTTVLNSDSTDRNPADNNGSYTFDVTQDIYSRHDSTFLGWYGTSDDDGDQILDAVSFQIDYEINATATLYGMNVIFTNAAWSDLEVSYNIFDGAGNALFDGVSAAVPTYTVTNAQLSPTDGSALNWITLPFDGGVTLDPANGNIFTFQISHDIDSLFIGVGSNTAYANPGTWTTAGIVYSGSSGGGDAGYYITDNYMWDLNFKAPNSINEEVANVELGQNMPNPANGVTTVSFSTENSAEVSFVVRDVTGKLISSEEYGTLPAGQHNINYNVAGLADGVYYYSVVVNGIATTKKMSVAK